MNIVYTVFSALCAITFAIEMLSSCVKAFRGDIPQSNWSEALALGWLLASGVFLLVAK